MDRGSLVISLDFELYWGLIDWRSLDSYAANLRGVRSAAAGMLELFRAYEVHATWATVGFLFLDGMDELIARRPPNLPGYANRMMDPYAYAERVRDSVPRELHFAPDVIETIVATPGQELASHTFSHFYCLEAPSSLPAFRSDLEAAIEVAYERFGIRLTSLVFPRNQYSPAHIRAAGELGITAYRGNPHVWTHTTRPRARDTRLARLARFADTYVPVHHDLSFQLTPSADGGPVDSRFLRPWTHGSAGRIAFASTESCGSSPRLQRGSPAITSGGTRTTSVSILPRIWQRSVASSIRSSSSGTGMGCGR